MKRNTELEKEMQLTKDIPLVSSKICENECALKGDTEKVDKGTKRGHNNRIVGTAYPSQNPI